MLKARYALSLASISLLGLTTAACLSQPNGANAPQTPAETNSAPAPELAPEREPDVVYIPTPPAVVDEMLRLADVQSDDMIYDLGSGDGRIVIAAAEEYGARGVGIDIDPERVQQARQNAEQANVADRVEFRQADLFESDFSEATVVTLYLLPDLNLRLRPQLLTQLEPGTRIVSHAFDMGEWVPEQVSEVEGQTIYYWEVPEDVPENLL
ncbi:hypothetical protein C8B47_00850 [filamentous cyanobacterium CCP4]|nr:hypothetical protein C8B47_00850 [filamentous cyanobacterium CCP4]